ncbi:MAG TPA: hypothetical protein VMV29_14660 [Ktedonobacterales bacterium]|nr:hypothetical protein [Ktedonobacterales bacterium]
MVASYCRPAPGALGGRPATQNQSRRWGLLTRTPMDAPDVGGAGNDRTVGGRTNLAYTPGAWTHFYMRPAIVAPAMRTNIPPLAYVPNFPARQPQTHKTAFTQSRAMGPVTQSSLASYNAAQPQALAQWSGLSAAIRQALGR